MAIDFPNSPTVNQTFTSGSTTWVWDGTAWNLQTTTTASNDSMPVGSIMWFAGSTAPNGWIRADGAVYTNGTYSNLFAVIGNTYGGTVGTSFAVPSVASTTGAYYIRFTTAVGVTSTLSLLSAPVGSMVQWPVTSSYPTGWIRCDGTSYSTTTYNDLFTLIQYTYGGSGASFNVPNISGAGTGSPVYIIKATSSGLIEPSTVAHASSHTQGGSDVISVTLNQVPSFQTYRNIIINGTGAVAQRNSGSVALTTSVAYGSVDRWAAFQATTAAGTISRITTGLPTTGTGVGAFTSGIRFGRNSGATSTGTIAMVQALETINSTVAAGKQVTLSYWAKAGANYSAASSLFNAIVQSGTGTDQAANAGGGWTGYAFPLVSQPVLTSSWTFYTVTGTVASNATQLEVLFSYTPVGTAGADDNVYITGVQLEVGSVATPFEFEPFETTLRKCQRYYFRHAPAGITYMSYVYAGSQYRLTLPVPIPMRINCVAAGTVTATGWAGGTTPALNNGDTTMGAMNFYSASGAYYIDNGTVITANAEL
jgi:microcystin-dependent protein